MSQSSGFPHTEVAVALVIRRDQVLLVFNPRWGTFTLPMTKRRRWADPNATKVREEPWVEAAARAAAECLGRTLKEEFRQVLDREGYWHGDATGEVKEYHHQMFEVRVSSETEPVPGLIHEWLAPADILDTSRRPISTTARYLIGEWRK